ncbi:MAG: flagellar basal-body rod protein FlgF [Desulfobulbus propionicus]|nr:MAG: flagellar basal-body rod protein FlgF [Desulfobulbus propionicus]
MVSGKYAALSGAIAREQALDNVASNLANVNTTGFKKNRISFESILRESRQITHAKGINYSRIRHIGTDHSQGSMQETGNPLDLAIEGEGFFKLDKAGASYYTRSGHFMLDQNGMVTTADGYNLVGRGNAPLKLPDAAGRTIVISQNGTISVDGIASGKQVQLYTVEDQQQLKKVGNTRFQLDQGNDLPMQEFQVLQGRLETSNVNMMEEMAVMINTQRKFEADMKVLNNYSTLSDKQDELGSVG